MANNFDPSLLQYLTPAERAELVSLLEQMPPWMPDPRNKPQCAAYVSEADELLYGGSSGGGKTNLALGLARTKHRHSIVLRRTFPDLERTVIEDAYAFFGDKKYYNSTKHTWRIPEGDFERVIEFGHLEHVGTPTNPRDEQQYAGAQPDFVVFDQLEQFPKYAYDFLQSRVRSAVRGQKTQLLSTANPMGEFIEWIIEHWAPWLDEKHPRPAKPGELRWYKRLKGDQDNKEVETTADDPDALSRTYIPAGLKDNPYLGEDYRKRLNLLPEPMRSALLDGLWSAMLTDDAYQVIPRAWIKAAQARWTANIPDDCRRMALVLGVDIARGGSDKTVISPRRGRWFAPQMKYEGFQTPDGQSVKTLLAPLMEQRAVANLDVIGVGASAYDISRMAGMAVSPVNFAEGSNATDKSGQLHFANKRAEYYWSLREALDPSSGMNLMLPPDPELLGDLTAPRWQPKLKTTIEDKEEIKKRLGRSPDCGDAIVLAWAQYYAPSAEELHQYGQDVVPESEITDDMIAYHADTYGMSYEQAKEDLLKHNKPGGQLPGPGIEV